MAVHMARQDRGEVVIACFRDPRTTSVLPLSAAAPEEIALAVASCARRDATVLLDLVDRGDLRAPADPVGNELGRVLPGAEVLVYDANAVLRFLWYFRDRFDPLTLGHSSDHDLDASILHSVRLPEHRKAGSRGGRRRGVIEIRDLLLTMGNALGVRPPIPTPDGSTPGWGLRRIAALMEAVAGMYAGLLYRWGSPLARIGSREDATELSIG